MSNVSKFDSKLSKVFTYRHGNFKVQWEWTGEGKKGKYNPEDSSDTPVYRVSLWDKTYSYDDKIDSLRTLTPLDTSEDFIRSSSERLLGYLQDNHGGVRNIFARWGWETDPNLHAE